LKQLPGCMIEQYSDPQRSHFQMYPFSHQVPPSLIPEGQAANAVPEARKAERTAPMTIGQYLIFFGPKSLFDVGCIGNIGDRADAIGCAADTPMRRA
jgi:hypothetical protein